MTIRVGLVGSQFAGGLYIRALKQANGAEIVAVASPNTSQQFAEKHGLGRHYKDYRSMLEDCELDAVAIATPNDLHYDVCLAAAHAGKQVLCTKPLALSLEECDTMIEACERSGVVLMYAENLLFAPMYARVRELARDGNVGAPFVVKHLQGHGGPYSPWFWDVDRAGGGALMDLGCHSIQVICWLMNEWPEAVTATLRRYRHTGRTEGEDHSTVLLHFAGGRLGIAENSWAMPGGDDRLEVYGLEGRLGASIQQGAAITMYREASEEAASDPAALPAGWQFPLYEAPWQYGFPQELEHFVDVVEGREELRSSGKDGRRVLEIICAAYESARVGRRVELPFESHREKPIDHWLAPDDQALDA